MTWKQRKVLETRIYLRGSLEPTAYRPLAYPTLLAGIFKLSQFGITQARMTNVLLFVGLALVFFLIVKQNTGIAIGFIATCFMIYQPEIKNYIKYLLTEVFAAAAVFGVFCLFLKNFKAGASYKTYFFLGTSLGFLYFVKTSFGFGFIALSIYFLAVAVFELKTNTSWQHILRKNLFLILGVATIVGPIFIYNIAATGTVALFSGTNAMNVVHGAYTQEYLDGTSVYKIRERHYREYEEANNVRVASETSRALVGKEIFRDVWQREGKRLFGSLVLFKVKSSLEKASATQWVIRALFILGAFFFFRSRVYWFGVFLVLGQMLAVSVFLHQSGRFLIPVWPIILFYAAMSAAAILERLPTRLIIEKFGNLALKLKK